MAVTLAQIKQRVRDLVDTESADFVDDAEILRYINEGIKVCEAEIHRLNEDYYKKDATLALVSGTSEYSLPSDIYAQKIRRIFFDDGLTKKYEILPVTDEKAHYIDDNETRFYYRLLFNESNEKVIKLYPTPSENDSSSVVITYIKDAAQLASDSDETDIPEFSQFVVDFARYRILQKEVSNPMLEGIASDLRDSRISMVKTLQNSVPDGNNEIELGDDIYDDFYSNFYDSGRGEY
jgi:hypothetical protein